MAQVIEAPARLVLAWAEYALHPIDSTNALLRRRDGALFPQSVVEIWATSAVIFILMMSARSERCLNARSIAWTMNATSA